MYLGCFLRLPYTVTTVIPSAFWRPQSEIECDRTELLVALSGDPACVPSAPPGTRHAGRQLHLSGLCLTLHVTLFLLSLLGRVLMMGVGPGSLGMSSSEFIGFTAPTNIGH